jgi:hypothetical protein
MREWKGIGVRERKGSNIKRNNVSINPLSRVLCFRSVGMQPRAGREEGEREGKRR